MTSVLQDWVEDLTMMQQSVLMTAVRGPDNLPKYHPSKYLLRWYRRCILLSAMDGRVLIDAYEPNGGSFTGPSVVAVDYRGTVRIREGFLAEGALRDGSFHGIQQDPVLHQDWMEALKDWVTAYIRGIDEVPHHFQLHFLHSVQILGYKHPMQHIRVWWYECYERLVYDMHLRPESEADMDERLGDNRDAWLRYGDIATEH